MKRLIILLLCIGLILTAILPRGNVSFAATAQTKKYIALTFDDGPSKYTKGLVDGLNKRGAKATFFVLGTNVDRYASIIKQMSKDGHELANHSYNHYNLPRKSMKVIQSQIAGVDAKIKKLTGKTPTLFRPPYGAVSANVTSAARAAGKSIMLWSIDPLDWKYRNSAAVARKVATAARPGAVILLHDIHATSVKGALAAVDKLKAQGYEFVTVSELFKIYGKSLRPGVKYNRAR